MHRRRRCRLQHWLPAAIAATRRQCCKTTGPQTFIVAFHSADDMAPTQARRRWLPAQAAAAAVVAVICLRHMLMAASSSSSNGVGGIHSSSGSSSSIGSSRSGSNGRGDGSTSSSGDGSGCCNAEGGMQEVFASLWGKEIFCPLGMEEETSLPPVIAKFNFVEVLRSVQVSCLPGGWPTICCWPAMLKSAAADALPPHLRRVTQDQGVGIIFISVRWKWQQPDPEGFDFTVMNYVQEQVCGQGLKLAVVLDTDATPTWVARRFPDGVLRDVLNLTRGAATFNHAGALELAHAWHDAVLRQLAANNASCIHSIQPSFNNEYESKYSQVGCGAGWARRRLGTAAAPPPPPGAAFCELAV